jgi:hypothetical protein
MAKHFYYVKRSKEILMAFKLRDYLSHRFLMLKITKVEDQYSVFTNNIGTYFPSNPSNSLTV